jgi:hypothetical protein
MRSTFCGSASLSLSSSITPGRWANSADHAVSHPFASFLEPFVPFVQLLGQGGDHHRVIRATPRTLVALLVAALATVALAAVPATAAKRTASTATASPTRLPLEQVRLLNYYPAGHGWAAMWTGWDAAEFDRDMARVASLGANSVRLIIQTSAFGFPTPTATMRDRLKQAVNVAAKHGLSVQLTLFDWFSSFSDITGSKAWASAVLKPFADDARVFSVELQNELNVDNPAAVTWAAAMLPHLRAVTSAPTTVSVNGRPARLATLKTLLGTVSPHFWSYHYYDQVLGSGADNAFAAAKAVAAPLPLHIGETGVDTVPRLGEDATTADARQDHFYRTVFTAARAQGLPAPSPWTLTDFVQGSYPGQQWAGQYSFGLFRLDGTAKPAAATVRQAFTGAPLGADFNGSFETASATHPAEWTQYLAPLTSIAVDRTTARTGTNSVRFSASLGDATGWPSLWTTPIEAIQPGRSYTATVWAKGVDVAGVNRLGLTWYRADGSYIGVAPSASVTLGTSDWQQLTATGVAPADAAMVAIQLQTTRNTGSVWFDDVTFG